MAKNKGLMQGNLGVPEAHNLGSDSVGAGMFSLIHRASQGTGIRIEFVANADHHKPHDGHGSNLPMDHD